MIRIKEMRNFALVLILVIFSAFKGVSQIINIPDENFKNYLFSIGIDTNEDGEISSPEAHAYTGPIIIDSLNISNLTGIWGFTNITFLSASYNNLTWLNLGFKYHLDTIIVDHNYLDTLIVGQCLNLKYLNCDYNHLSSISFNYLMTEIEKIDCSYNEFTKISFPYYIFNNLKYLDCSNNNISYINLDSLPEVIELDCSFNIVNNIIYPDNLKLKVLNCRNNNLSELQIPELTILQTLNCSYNLIDSLNLINSLKILDCSNNFIDSLNLNESLKILDCSNNEMSVLDLTTQPQLEFINCSYNELKDLNFSDCNEVDTIICSYNQLEELSLLYNFNLNWVDFSYNSYLDKLCVSELPITFGIADDGTDYIIEVCTQEFQNTFKAGQILSVLNFNSQNHYILDSAKFDLTGDYIFDIKFTSIRDGLPGYWGSINFYVQPVNQTLMAGESFNVNDLIFPNSFSWSTETKHIYYAYGDISFCCETYWWIDPYLAFKTPVSSDTIISYIFFEEREDFLMNISNYATWTPCLDTFSLGNDTVITLKDTLTLNAGSDFQDYFWNTGDTTQFKTIIGDEFGAGVWNIGVYVNNLNCYYTDTIQVQIIDDSGISETESKILKTYPNPTQDHLKIINHGSLACDVSLFDLNGRKLISLELFKEAEINMSDYPKGIYYLHYVTKDDTGTLKIIKL